VNTRCKILTLAAVPAMQRPVLLVTGRFEILRAELVRELAEARRRTGAQTLIAVVRPLDDERVALAARAELAAALRVIDYVLILENEPLDSLADTFQPAEIIHLEEADLRRTWQLIEHVHRCGKTHDPATDEHR
jgi:bifunctional ADP-heptose synthase (sugar kinase/adenylyltransferase)